MSDTQAEQNPQIISPEQQEVLLRRSKELVDQAHENRIGIIYFMDKSHNNN